MADVTVYDKAKWHYEHRTYPAGLDESQGYLYGGFYLAWAAAHGHLSDDFLHDFGATVEQLVNRTITPAAAYEVIDGVLTTDTFNDRGNAFADYLFESDSADYYGLFEEVLTTDLPSPYHVEDSWENYDKLAPVLDRVYQEWLSAK